MTTHENTPEVSCKECEEDDVCLVHDGGFPNTPEVVESWEEEFDDRFGRAGFRANNVDWTVCAPEIKNFIRTLLTSQKQKQIEEIVGIVTHMPNATRDEVHNEKVICVDDLITKIQAKQ